MRFDYRTGAVMAIHREHNLNKNKGWYELAVQEAGFKAGHSIILEAEPQNIYKLKSTEGTWDGYRFEIAAAETATPNNIRNALKHCASKPDCEVAVVFFPNGYSEALFEDGLGKFKGLKGTTQFKAFHNIICIHKGEVVQEISLVV